MNSSVHPEVESLIMRLLDMEDAGITEVTLSREDFLSVLSFFIHLLSMRFSTIDTAEHDTLEAEIQKIKTLRQRWMDSDAVRIKMPMRFFAVLFRLI